MLNKIMIMGRLTRDPELRTTLNGTHVAAFTLAVERDFISRYFTKGRMAVVEGRLQMRDWTDKDGNKRRSAEVVADSIYFGDSKAPAKSEGNATERDFPPMPQQSFAEMDDDDGPLPF